MPIDPQTLSFIGLAAILTVAPGADTMLVIRSVMARGPAAGLLTTAGICSGLFVHATLSAAGLSLIILNSALAFQFLKTAGAIYLVILGIQSLRKLFTAAPRQRLSTPAAAVPANHPNWRYFFEGLLNNVLNPKPAVFYLALLPQFIGSDDPVFLKSLLLAGIHFVMGVFWLSAISLFMGRLKHFLSSERVHRWLEASSGAILIALGVRLAMEKQ